jgi:hypothetical protein
VLRTPELLRALLAIASKAVIGELPLAAVIKAPIASEMTIDRAIGCPTIARPLLIHGAKRIEGWLPVTVDTYYPTLVWSFAPDM